jgi:hypothetical protein
MEWTVPSQVNEEMTLVARDCQSILDICDKLADAGRRLAEGDRTRLLDSPQLAGRLAAADHGSQLWAAARLMDAPVVARIVCKDETNRTRIFYTTPAAPPPGVARANLSSLYSPFGRLTVLPLGGSLVTPKGERLVLTERALLRPKDYLSVRDVANTLFESTSREAVRVRSLRSFQRAFGERRAKDAAAEAAAGPVAPEELEVVVDEGEIRPPLLSLSLAQPLIPDAVQDELARLPLLARPLIIGPPGSGKTTALIRRLDFLISREAAEAAEPGSYARLDERTALPHAASWALFVPTGELLAYLRESFSALLIPGFDHGARAWEQARLEMARDDFGLLGPGALELAPDGRGGLAAAAASAPIEWYRDFAGFQASTWTASLAARAKTLSGNRDEQVAALGRTLVELLEAAGRLPGAAHGPAWFHQAFAPHLESVAELVEERRQRIRSGLKSAFRKLESQDPGLVRDLVSLSAGGRSGPADEPQAGPDRLRPAAWRLYAQTVSDLALAVHQGRNLSEDSLSGRAAAWLGQGRLPGPAQLADLGADRAALLALKRFKVDDRLFLGSYFDSILPNYLRFKRRSQLWYRPGRAAPGRVEAPEIDLLLLATLAPAAELARLEASAPGSVAPCRAVARHRRLMRNQVVIDEAAGFTPVQLKAMACLAHPAGAVSAAADLGAPADPSGAQPGAPSGSGNLSDLRWALGKIDPYELGVNYRQSLKLSELADAVAGGGRARFGGHHYGAPGPRPAMVVKAGAPAGAARWVAARIGEIRDRSQALPSVAVIAPQRLVGPLSEALARLLAPIEVEILLPGRATDRPSVVRILTPAQARGLEFEAVLLVDPEPGGLYLGATRAATYLGLCLTGALAPELEFLRSRTVVDWAQPEVPLETLSL